MEHHLILRVITKLLVPPILLFGLYVQFHGDFGPGGGFQAGVIFAVAFILYGLVFTLDEVQRVFPPWLVHKLAALGVLVYAGVGVLNLMAGAKFLDYNALANDAISAQHWGILAVEFGVGLTVAAVMVTIYYAFAGRPPRMSDEDW
ncbi:MAG: Na(+)/H(+) antiporter subunit B [Pseudomonadota bacterium]